MRPGLGFVFDKGYLRFLVSVLSKLRGYSRRFSQDCFRGFWGRLFGGAELAEAAIGTVELVVDAGLLEEEIVEVLPAFVEQTPGFGGLGDGVLVFVVGGGGIAEEGGFDGPGAALFPEGDGHFFDAGEFEGGLGGEVGEEVIEEFLEAFATFAGEEDGVGGESVFEGVAGGAGAGFLGEGSAGAGAVAAGGGDLCW